MIIVNNPENLKPIIRVVKLDVLKYLSWDWLSNNIERNKLIGIKRDHYFILNTNIQYNQPNPTFEDIYFLKFMQIAAQRGFAMVLITP